jgi:prepilin-type processing-associated H-X9-DG protein
MLMPALSRARQQAYWVQCQSNLRQCGIYLNIYANQWKGYPYPPGLGANRPLTDRWPVHVFKPPVYNPPIMLCPVDLEPNQEHSYILNAHLADRGIKFGSKDLGGLTSSEVILMGEKRSSWADYYMNVGDYPERVEPYRHGLRLGSNYLYLDGHVGTLKDARDIVGGIDPWDPAPPPTP